MKTQRIYSYMLCLVCTVCSVPTWAQQHLEYARKLPLVTQSLLLDITKADNRWVAVGERGHVVWSTDGQTWQQAEAVPTRSTLTSVFYTGGQLWAGGHDATIISSGDLGSTWTQQNFDHAGDAILDIYFIDKNNGFALGAYSLLLTTSDGGQSWSRQDLNETVTASLLEDAEAAEEDVESEGESAEKTGFEEFQTEFEDLGCYEYMECHLNVIVQLDSNRMMLIGEQGFGFRSVDRGASWEAFRLPYQGSMFGALVYGQGCVLTYGLRGNAYQSCDFGTNWQTVNTQTESSLLGGVVSNGTLTLAGSGGAIVSGAVSRLSGLATQIHPSGVDFSALVATDGGYLLVGEDGLHSMSGKDSAQGGNND